MRWDETNVVVTGATRGIGRAVAEALVHRGARVGCVARSARDLAALGQQIGSDGTVEVAPADVGVREGVEKAIAALREKLGAVDVLVNNAGIGLYGPVVDLDPADAERVMRVNYLGTVYATCAVLPGMVERRRGHVVNVASIAGRIGAPFEAAYSASKFAVVGFSEALATEVSPFGVKVSLVNPGPVATSFFEARGHPYDRRRPRPIPAGQVAATVCRAIERGSLEQTVPRSLGPSVLARHLVPPLYLAGTRRVFRQDLARLAAEREGG